MVRAGRDECITLGADGCGCRGPNPTAPYWRSTGSGSRGVVNDRLGFVIIMEQGNLEYQTLLLVESIRRLPTLQKCPLYVVQPRAGRRPSERTLRGLAQHHDALFVFGDLNRTWRHSGTMNKAYATALARKLASQRVCK